MQRVVSAADANRKFSEVLRCVRAGDSYLVTSHGHPVARIVPVERNGAAATRAKLALVKHLRGQKPINIGAWTRDELYQD